MKRYNDGFGQNAGIADREGNIFECADNESDRAKRLDRIAETYSRNVLDMMKEQGG